MVPGLMLFLFLNLNLMMNFIVSMMVCPIFIFFGLVSFILNLFPLVIGNDNNVLFDLTVDVVSVTEPEDASVSSPRDSNIMQSKANDSRSNDQVTPVYADEVSNVSVGGQEENNHSGILPNNCLPFLASTVASIDKKRPLSPGTPSSKRKPSLKLSFKRREGNVTNPTLGECCYISMPSFLISHCSYGFEC
jgi:hypothetical protein